MLSSISQVYCQLNKAILTGIYIQRQSILLIVSEILRRIMRAQYKIKFDRPPCLKNFQNNHFPVIADRHPDTFDRDLANIYVARKTGSSKREE